MKHSTNDSGAPFDNDGPVDRLEGRYTETDPETAEARTVHGQYTRGDGHEPDPVPEGGYTDEGEPTHLTEERHGKYARTEE